DQGMTAGAAMAFMVAGSVSSIPAMTAVFALVKKPVFALYVMLGFLGAVSSGVLYQLLT
ncbi:MAG: permease, partial [Pseudomonadota bacterium]